ncbi:hypothetical protein [Sinorhizobium fredii]|uniref:hypothetical protein n=1 Tax=Rhizobium fredii TaxID=380 RepID=UPI0004AE0DD6|nr:hypothetical protein [Sinorhizobium fredii]
MPHSLPALRLQRQAMAFPLNAPAFKPLAAAQGWAHSEAVSGEMARNNQPFDPFTAGCRNTDQ